MKNNIIVALIALGIGLGGGYLLFKGEPPTRSPSSEAEHIHNLQDESIWTCSMHPQIRQEDPGVCPICEMDLIPLKQNNSNDPLVLEMTPEAVKLAQIQTSPVVYSGGGKAKAILLSGKIEADERRSASLVSHVSGRIEELYISFTGEQVSKGQIIASLYSPEFINAQRELLLAQGMKEENPELLEAARKKMAFWKIPEKTIEEILNSGEILEKIAIFAESGGAVVQKRISVGDYVQAGGVLFDLIDLSRLWVILDVYEADLPNIRRGNSVEFTTPALSGQRFTTRINYIDPMIDPEKRTASIRAEVVNTNGLLKPEMLVRAKLLGAQAENGSTLTVPKSAVLWTGQRSVVYVKQENLRAPSYAYREIELGEALGQNFVVLSGLKAGEEVVTNGAFTIDAAAQLNNQQSMMNRFVNIKGEEKIGTDFRKDLPTVFNTQLLQLVNAYMEMKDAYVATDAVAASTIAANFLKTLDEMETYLLQGEAYDFWIEKHSALQAYAGKIQKEKEVEAQRQQFEFLSTTLIELVRAFGIKDKAVYIQYCPMAFDDRGADWLSFEKEILNPYFGDAMLTCGTVKDSIE